MRKILAIAALAFLFESLLPASPRIARAQSSASLYPAMAPLDQYLISGKDSEIALARSAAPKSISDAASVMVLTRTGYETASSGANGFLCLVERSWGADTANSDFWNPKVRSPICFNPAAARTFAPIYLLKTRLVLAGKSKSQILQSVSSALDSKSIPPLEPGSMCYMLSKQQYLNDAGKSWHPHVMFFVSGDVASTWGANLDGSPMIAASDPEERVTIFILWLPKWSDGSPAPAMDY